MTPDNPKDSGPEEGAERWKLQATIIQTTLWTLDAKQKTQFSLTSRDRPLEWPKKKWLVSHRFESVIAYFVNNKQNSTNELPLLPGSGRVFGHTYLLAEIKRLVENNGESEVLQNAKRAIAACLHIGAEDLNNFLKSLQDTRSLENDKLKGRDSVILEATYKLNTTTKRTLRRGRRGQPKGAKDIQDAFPGFETEAYTLQAIRLRIGVIGASKYSDKKNIRAGLFAGPVEIGMRYEESIEAGIDYVYDIHTYPPIESNPDDERVPPAFLLST
jgi:hypothetical protein